VLVLGGLLGICVGLYGLLDAGGPPALGLPLLAGGVVAAAAGLLLGGRRTARTRYRPDPWALPEWLVAGSGVACAASFVWSQATSPSGLIVATTPLTVPPLPAVAAVGALLALLPAWLAPPPPTPAGRAAEVLR
jgi:energy-coupling factor transport system permease protein